MELGVFPHTRDEARVCGFCVPNPLVYSCVQCEVLADLRPKVRELVQYFRLVVVNSGDW